MRSLAAAAALWSCGLFDRLLAGGGGGEGDNFFSAGLLALLTGGGVGLVSWFVGEKEGAGGACVFSCKKPDSAFCWASRSSTPDCGALDAFGSILGAGLGGVDGVLDGVGAVLGGLGGF